MSVDIGVGWLAAHDLQQRESGHGRRVGRDDELAVVAGPPDSPVMNRYGGPPIGALISTYTNSEVYEPPPGSLGWAYAPSAVSPKVPT